MQALADDPLYVAALVFVEMSRVRQESQALVERQEEAAVLGFLLDDVNGHDRDEPSVGNLAEHDDREPQAHGFAELVVRSATWVLAGGSLLVGVPVERVAMVAVVILAVGVAHDGERARVGRRVPDPLADVLDALRAESEVDT